MSAARTFLNTRFPGPLPAWWNFRRKRFWGLTCFLLYTLAGFLLAPWIVHTQLEKFVREELRLEPGLDRVRINPLTLTLELEGLSIARAGATPMAGISRIFVNVQTSSLLRRALVLRELTLEQPFGNLILNETGSLNLAQLVPAPADPETRAADTDEDAGSFPFLIRQLNISGAELHFTDETRPTPFTTGVGPVNISLVDLNTLPDMEGDQSVTIVADDGITLAWNGEIDLAPFTSSGQFRGSGRFLALASDYFSDMLAFELDDGGIELAFNYSMSQSEAGFQAEIAQASLTLSDLDITQQDARGSTISALELPSLNLSDIAYSWPGNSLAVGEVLLEDVNLNLWRSEAVPLSLLNLVEMPETDPADPDADEAAGTPLTWQLDQFTLSGMDTVFTDYALSDTARLAVTDINLSVTGLNSADEALFPFSLSHSTEAGGLSSAEGSFGMYPSPSAEVDITTSELPLLLLQSWVEPFANILIESGSLDQQLHVSMSQDQAIHLSGDITVNQLDITDTLHEERLAGWDALVIEDIELDLATNQFEVSEITLRSPYSRVTIREDGSTNFQELLILTEENVAAEQEASSTISSLPIALTIGNIIIEEGSSDFSDFSLPLPFATQITSLDGDISTLSTTSNEPASITMTGDVDSFGLAEIRGEVLPLNPASLLDLQVLFRNVELPNMSPYTVKFAGQAIDDGRMDLDLQYSIDEGNLVGSNTIVIRQLALGEKTDQPGAVNLPLGLAVALLKKADGTIDLDLEVSGDINDPDFNVGGIILDTFANLITRLVASPFNLLGSLVGAGEDADIGMIEFRPGQSDLAPPELGKLQQLGEALALRPELNLAIPGIIDPGPDSEELRRQQLSREVEALLDAEPATEELLSQRRRRIVETLATERLSVDLAALEATYTREAEPEDPESIAELDQLAYVSAIESLLEENLDITEADLELLARNRAEAVRAALLLDSTLDASRITLIDSQQAELNDAGWIPVELELTTP